MSSARHASADTGGTLTQGLEEGWFGASGGVTDGCAIASAGIWPVASLESAGVEVAVGVTGAHDALHRLIANAKAVVFMTKTPISFPLSKPTRFRCDPRYPICNGL